MRKRVSQTNGLARGDIEIFAAVREAESFFLIVCLHKFTDYQYFHANSYIFRPNIVLRNDQNFWENLEIIGNIFKEIQSMYIPWKLKIMKIYVRKYRVRGAEKFHLAFI